MPAFNAGNKLLVAVKSIQQQTLNDWELILMDDGSTDNSIKKIKFLNDKRIKIYRFKSNKGLTFRLNQAIRLSCSKYIARMDADDISFPTRFQEQVSFLENNSDIDLVATRALIFNSKNMRIMGLLPYKDQIYSSISYLTFKTIPMPHPSWMGKKEWFLKHMYKEFNTLLAEDQEMLLRTISESKFHTIPKVLLAYRYSGLNLYKLLQSRFTLLKIQIEILAKRKQYLFILIALLFYFIKIFIDLIIIAPKIKSLYYLITHRKVSKEIQNEFNILVRNTL